jgi:hypothetical protein
MKPVRIDKTVFCKGTEIVFSKTLCSRIIMTPIGSAPQNVQTGSRTHMAPRSNDTGVLYRKKTARA